MSFNRDPDQGIERLEIVAKLCLLGFLLYGVFKLLTLPESYWLRSPHIVDCKVDLCAELVPSSPPTLQVKPHGTTP